MRIFAEKEAEEFLAKEKFNIIKSIFIQKESELKKTLEKLKFPVVMKVSGKKILHKNKIGGVKTNIQSYEQALEIFNSLIEVKDSEGVIIQNQIQGEEFLLGIKKTPEFGHVIAFGVGGVKVEQMKKVDFRIYPMEENEIENMIKEIKSIHGDDLDAIKNNIIKLCSLSEKYPNISELDINPLIVNKGKAIVVDARVSFD